MVNSCVADANNVANTQNCVMTHLVQTQNVSTHPVCSDPSGSGCGRVLNDELFWFRLWSGVE